MLHKYTIRLRCGFAELWRYNMAVECAGFGPAGERVCFVAAQSVVAPVGAGLRSEPASPKHPRELTVTTEPCDSITAYVYVITNTQPASRVVKDSPPFDLKVRIAADGDTVYDAVHKINQWGGTTIEIKLPQAAGPRL